jgi:hypothetical protein
VAGPPNHLHIRFSATAELCTCVVFKTAVTVALVIKNVCLHRRRKAKLVTSKMGAQTPTSFTHLVAQKPDQTPAVQSVRNLSRTEAGLQNAVSTKPCVEMSCMSNQ